MDFDGRQYYVAADDGGDDSGNLRAIATRLDDVPFLSIRAIGPDDDKDWTFLAYSLPDREHLTLRLVDPGPFEDVLDDVGAVRHRLAELLEDEETFLNLVSCRRRDGSRDP
jgi:hypothetical protein